MKPKPARQESSFIYGVMPVLEALRSGRRSLQQVMLAEGAKDQRLQEIFTLARQADVPVRPTPRGELTRLANGANHQGVLACLSAAQYTLADELLEKLFNANEPAFAVVLDGVEDPRNLGAIIRAAECVGAQGVFVPERRAVGLTETVAKASAGALEHLPVARVTNISRLLEELKERGVWVVGADAEARQSYTEWDWTLPCVLVMGGEGAGLRRLVRETCDALVSIPQYGAIGSLNVSVATGVILYEARRQRIVHKTLN
jgi:23S rRNA (guanosine2251-2'-O)-methyltransferase